MLKDVLSSSGLEHWGMIGLVIFVIAFAAIVYLAWKIPKRKVDEFSRLPLEDDTKNGHSRDEETKDAGE